MAPRRKRGVADDAAKTGKAVTSRRTSKASKSPAAKPARKAGKFPASQLTKPAEPLFFYGHTNPNGCLSKFYLSAFDHSAKTYVCNEQFFHYAEAALFQDFVGACK
jgi:hypothetical protein